MKPHHPNRRAAFTLVELLVVIAIITILASLIAAGAFYALTPAKDAAIQLQVKQADSAVESYALEGNRGYFPTETISAAGKAAFVNHLKNAYRYNRDNRAVLDGVLAGGFPNLDPSETLVYFLGGNALFPGSNGAIFSIKKNSTNPITGAGEITVWFDFDVTRLSDPDGDGFYSFQPKYVDDASNAPLVYFAAADYGNATSRFDTAVAGAAVNGVARPYGSSVTGGPIEPRRFQIICAGQDGHFGADAAKQYPSGQNYDLDFDVDNISNFGNGRFENELP